MGACALAMAAGQGLWKHPLFYVCFLAQRSRRGIAQPICRELRERKPGVVKTMWLLPPKLQDGQVFAAIAPSCSTYLWSAWSAPSPDLAGNKEPGDSW